MEIVNDYVHARKHYDSVYKSVQSIAVLVPLCVGRISIYFFDCGYDSRGKFGICFSPQGVETCDTLALAKRLRPGLERYALAYLIGALGVDGVNSHDALDDAYACAGLLFRLV